jgi:VCBS repeat-containing protein
VADTYTTLEDVPLIVPAASGILTNDTDVDGDPLTAVLVGNVSHGVLNLNTNGSFTYLSATNYNGSDSFTYRANDGTTNGNLATVTINITPVNDPPVANNDSYTTPENVSLIVPAAAGILTNDVDVDGDVLSAWLVTNVSHGSLNLKPDGSFTYTPNTNFYGSDAFTYLEDDGQIAGNIATVTINVVNTNAPLSFDSEAMTASGYNLHLSAPWGYVCVIEASTNLVVWIPIFTNSTLSGSFVFTDQTATNIPSRFYRAFAR